MNIGVLSYEHESSRSKYTLNTLGNDFEISIAPENILMALSAHHEAKKLIEEGNEVTILTLGGCATSNASVIGRINDLTNTNIPIIADTESNSIASNLQSLTKYESPFIIICQKFAKPRTYVHSKYYLGQNNFHLIDWESYLEGESLNEFESNLLLEIKGMTHIPTQRKVLEGVLTILAVIDPENGFTKQVSSLRQKLRSNNPADNIFNKTGLS